MLSLPKPILDSYTCTTGVPVTIFAPSGNSEQISPPRASTRKVEWYEGEGQPQVSPGRSMPSASRVWDEPGQACVDFSAPFAPPRSVTPPPMIHSGKRGRSERAAITRAFERDRGGDEDFEYIRAPSCRRGERCVPASAEAFDRLGHRLVPDVRRPLVFDDVGQPITWGWDGDSEPTHPDEGEASETDPGAAYFVPVQSVREALDAGTHACDALILEALKACTADGNLGADTTGVRAWKSFCKRHGRAWARPVDPRAPAWVLLQEELWIMRFVAELVEQRPIQPSSARNYFGQASGWHQREYGLPFAGGLDLRRLKEMVRGLRRLRDEPDAPIRRGVAPQQLQQGMDAAFPKGSAENANIRAALSTALQGLLRAREMCSEEGKGHRPDMDLARGDIATLTSDRFGFFMRPAKKMRQGKGKTVPIVIGAGGTFVDAHAEVCEMLRLDPTPAGQEATTPMFRRPDGSPFTTAYVRELVRIVMAACGEDPSQFGAHSLRIGGATALLAAGADPIHIKTMGRWSSDCWRLYVRACFEQTLVWTRKAGSQIVNDVAGLERGAQVVGVGDDED